MNSRSRAGRAKRCFCSTSLLGATCTSQLIRRVHASATQILTDLPPSLHRYDDDERRAIGDAATKPNGTIMIFFLPFSVSEVMETERAMPVVGGLRPQRFLKRWKMLPALGYGNFPGQCGPMKANGMAYRSGNTYYCKWKHYETGNTLQKRIHTIDIYAPNGSKDTLTGDRLPDEIVTVVGERYQNRQLMAIFLSADNLKKRGARPIRELPPWPSARDVISMIVGMTLYQCVFTVADAIARIF